MSEIKTGFWQNIFNGSYIKVRSVGLTVINYNEEGCKCVYNMDVSVLLDNYRLYEADKPKPDVDDTFNDDTPAQTFGDLDTRYSRVKFDASKMRLIGIHGPARAGKDTLASYLLDNLSDDWTRSSFADPMKAMLNAIDVDTSDEAKDLPLNQYGLSTRHMLQTLGTEWGRDRNGNSFWIDVFSRSNAGKCVIVPDVRFENEAELVREHGVLIHLVGRGGIEGNHASENALGFKPGDIVIDNSRDLAWLHGQVDSNAVLGDFVSAE